MGHSNVQIVERALARVMSGEAAEEDGLHHPEVLMNDLALTLAQKMSGSRIYCAWVADLLSAAYHLGLQRERQGKVALRLRSADHQEDASDDGSD